MINILDNLLPIVALMVIPTVAFVVIGTALLIKDVMKKNVLIFIALMLLIFSTGVGLVQHIYIDRNCPKEASPWDLMLHPTPLDREG